MTVRKIQLEITVEEIDRELIARGAQIPDQEPFNFNDKNGTHGRNKIMKEVKAFYDSISSTSLNPRLKGFSTDDLIKKLLLEIEKKTNRGIWGEDSRMDFYQLEEIEKAAKRRGKVQLTGADDRTIEDIEKIKKNSESVVAICMANDLISSEKGFSTLRVKNYKKVFNLCESEPFKDQPIAAGRLCTGFLVKEDVIATAGHFACEKNFKELRIVFGFKMLNRCTPVTNVPNKDIYKGVKIIHRVYDPMGSGADWALVELDRKVVDHPVVKLSEKDIYRNQPVYIIGHPVGLPLKYSGGAQVRDITDTCFSANLNVYSGNSGSPVFCKNTHEVIGIVVRGDNQDFRWTGKGWISVIYPNPDIPSKEPQCTRVSEFIAYVDQL